jgi:hypothetical protein
MPPKIVNCATSQLPIASLARQEVITHQHGEDRPWAECPLRVFRVILAVGRLLPVLPGKQTFSATVGMSQRCHQETHAPQQTASLFDHLVGTAEQRWRYGETE